jgi:amino acid transporter
MYSIVGPDYISLIGGEVRNPRRILPRAFKLTIYRVFFFYVIGAFCVGIVASSDDEALLGAIADGAPGAAKSPYVICKSRSSTFTCMILTRPAMNRLNIPYLPSIVNAAVLISIFSTTNSFVFAASRSLFGMAQRGQAPKILARTNKRGVPWIAVSLTLVVGCLAYLSVSQGSIKVLNWWINLVTAAQLVSWTCIAM